ncbi:MAG TPA: ABC transporter ATP-binding protein [Microthrixaceae bacterium]|nr:ABC transporter ATP-binding protein [Microthrixaceae bacterium]
MTALADRPAPPRAAAVATAPLEGRGLRKQFGERAAVDDVDLRVAAGEIVGLLGGNGAGKTTTFRLLAGILESDGGEVLVDGELLTRRSTRLRSALGLVPQSIALYPLLTGRENLRLFGRIAGVGRRDLRRRIDELLEIVDLADRADEPVHHLSGGMARRLNLAAGLVHRPRVLLLDEPVVGVDPQSRRAIFDLIVTEAAQGTGVLYTSHQLDEAERLCDRFVVLDRGRVAAEGSVGELFAEPSGGAIAEEVVRIRLRGPAESVDGLELLPFVVAVRRGESTIDVVVDDAGVRLSEVAAAVGPGVAAVEIPTPTLEQRFLDLTGAS